ncbi:MAG: hypothetical protein UX98_C0017G0004 [Parcubacteria group bacterium GW2011_GWA2_47_26]|nr:MAG: hypothetical protein UX98_C0017G0004 [Parcubacteria group bacterium GW2011_GWA2_47_26]
MRKIIFAMSRGAIFIFAAIGLSYSLATEARLTFTGTSAVSDSTLLLDATTSVTLGNATTNPSVNFLGSGAVTLNQPLTFGTGRAVTAGSYQIGRDADATNQLHFNVPTGATMEWSINDNQLLQLSNSELTVNGPTIIFTSAGGVSTGTYAIGRDIDANEFHFNVPTGATMEWSIDGVSEMLLSTTNFTPGANDGNALGSTVVSWSDLFLASGGIVNFNNGDVTLTHSSNRLEYVGGEILSTVPNGANYSALRLINNDTTNNLNMIELTDTTTGNALNIVKNVAGGSGLYIESTFAGGATMALKSAINVSVSSGTQSNTITPIYTQLEFAGSSAATGTVGDVTFPAGGFFSLDWSSTGTATELYGLVGLVSVDGTVGQAVGSLAVYSHGGTGTITTGIGQGILMAYGDTGTTTNSKGLSIAWSEEAAHTQTNQTGIEIDALSLGSSTNIGLDIEDVSGATNNFAIRTGTGIVQLGDRLQLKQGANVAGANNLSLGAGNFFIVTGATQVNCLDTTNWRTGSVVILYFQDGLTVADNSGTCNGANKVIQTTGNANEAVGATAVRQYIFNGTDWSQL